MGNRNRSHYLAFEPRVTPADAERPDTDIEQRRSESNAAQHGRPVNSPDDRFDVGPAQRIRSATAAMPRG